MAKVKDQQAEATRWVEDPLYWAKTVGGAHFDPWSGQEAFWREYGKILNAKIRKWNQVELTEEEERYARKFGISIMAGQGVGKGATISLAGLHYAFCLQSVGFKAVCTAPAGPQLHSSLWPEFGAWLQRSEVLAGLFEKTSDRIWLKEDTNRGTVCRIEPRTVQPDADAEKQKVVLAGTHQTGVLYLVDEASGVPEPVFEPIEGGLTDPLSIVIVIFNPTKRQGFAVETHRKNRDQWVCLHWNGEELRAEKRANPGRFRWFNEDVQLELARKYGADSDFYRVRVKGLPPNQASDTLIGYEDVMAATERVVVTMPGDPLAIAVDVAGADGGDRSIVLSLRGPLVLGMQKFQNKKTYELADLVAGQVANEVMNLPPETQVVVGVDSNGIGRGVYEHLMGVQAVRNVTGVNVTESALDPTRFHRLRDQIYWELREAFVETRSISLRMLDASGQVVTDDDLIGQLTSIKWAEVGGKIKVQGKGSSSGIPDVRPLAQSPDEMDALAIAWYLYRHRCSRVPAAHRRQRTRHRRTVSMKAL